MNINKELLKGNLVTIVLKVLSKGENYGHGIIKQLEDESEKAFQMKEGSLYPILHALEFEGQIKSFERLSESGRKRKYYKITNTGKKELKKRLNDWESFKGLMDRMISLRSIL